MKALSAIDVQPELPERLSALLEIAYNLRWCWHPEAIQLLRRLDPDLWESTGHNPVLMLGTIQQERLEAIAADEGLLAQIDRIATRLREYRHQTTWYDKTHGKTDRPRVAYFSAEFGLTECLPIYSGGLGVLAGDHLKAASELGIPLVGVGLLYQKGYFQQYLNADGWQQETYPDNDFYNLPLRPLIGHDGRALKVAVEFPGRRVLAQVWEVTVGRTRLFLMDCNVPENASDDRMITAELYGGDSERRIQQEIVLGMGGVRALATLGWESLVCHLNEGHSAFSALERVRMLMRDHGMTTCEAVELVRKSTIFTTHTAVPAGIDEFPEPLVRTYFNDFAAGIGIDWPTFMSFGRLRPEDRDSPFNMFALAVNLSYRANGVSQLHGQVSRRLWQRGWPELPMDEIPIGSVTNGIHTRSWISLEMSELYDRYLGPAWASQPADQTIWRNIDRIPDEELWRTHERRRERMVAFARRRLVRQLERRGALDHEIQAAREALQPDALTIGFARRFATYKRATLLFRDRERLKRLVTGNDRPVQIIIAGKAHPRDHQGKELIKEIVHFSRHPELRRHIVFLEDYDLSLARNLVQGVDVWLNTPRRPLEACGTSGMKAVFNGGLNASILDGWWDEAYHRDCGWAIGSGEMYSDSALQDEVEANALYHLLEEEVIPLFYDRGPDHLPRAWIARMKNSMRRLCPQFNANRMVREYTERFYLPAIEEYEALAADREALRAYCSWKEKIRQNWDRVMIVAVESPDHGRTTVGKPVTVSATVALGALSPEDVQVQLFIGLLDAQDEIGGAVAIPLAERRPAGDGRWVFTGSTTCPRSGRHGYSLRVLPSHVRMTQPFETRLIRWPALQRIRPD
ncbi:MAG: alpha-glucan family phosphorylase [Candidatus Zixiibacteriota bacterium]